MITLLLLLHAVVGIGLLVVGDRLGRAAFLVASVPLAATSVWLLGSIGRILDGDVVTASYTWVDSLDLRIDLRVDAFATLMMGLVAGIGVLVCVYSWSYFSDAGPATARLAALVCLFAGAMTGVVVSDHLLALFVFWELTSVTSYLLIGNDERSSAARAAALQALLITGAGGLVMLFGIVVVGASAGTLRLSEIIDLQAPTDGWFAVGVVCVLVGAFAKSAQVPLGSWLPGAMVAPTPISAYLHSATMVKAGVYLIARLSGAWSDTGPFTVLAVGVGLTTMIVGGLRALRQTDLKLLLAHGTTSQLGLLVVLFGLGEPAVAQAAVVMLVAHAAFKASLFMVVGMVDHELGTRDVRRLGVLGPRWRPTIAVAVVGAASMAGLAPLLGFIGKEKALDALWRSDSTGSLVAFVGVVAGSVLTVAYSARFVLGLCGRLRDDRHPPAGGGHPPAGAFVAPAMALALVTLVTGAVPQVVDRLVAASTTSLHPMAKTSHLALWHGVNMALVTSAVVVAAGLALVAARDRIAPVLASGARVPSADSGYRWLLTHVTIGARRITALVQHGSLPVYASVVLMTIAVPATLTLVLSGVVPGAGDVVADPLEIPLVGVIVVAGLGAALLTGRFAAAVLLGGVGYGMAGVYALLGAPDLALTQFAVETLSVGVFMMTLRHLPDQVRGRTPLAIAAGRLVVSACVATFVFVFALTMSTVRTERPVSDGMFARSMPEAKGENIVNVIIVDFRGLDTLGEIAVLMVTVLGAVSLVRPDRLGRRSSADGATP